MTGNPGTARLIAILALGVFAGTLVTRITDPLVIVLAQDLGAPAARVALLASAFALPFALIQPILGPVGDALGKRRVIALGLTVLTVLLAISSLAPTLDSLLVLRALAGLAAGGVMPLSIALVGDSVGTQDRQVALSRLLAFAIAGQIAGGTVAGLLEPYLGWRGVMIAAGAPGFLKQAYRKFSIKSALTPGDDFAMMREVLSRRFVRLAKEEAHAPVNDKWRRPDLVLIDGGPGQLAIALQVFADLGVEDVALASISKGPDRDAGREHFYLPGKEPFRLDPKSPVLYYLQRLRDEAHRFVVGGHRKKRSMAIGANPLDEIGGIGAAAMSQGAAAGAARGAAGRRTRRSRLQRWRQGWRR
jgi:hypothetical protein